MKKKTLVLLSVPALAVALPSVSFAGASGNVGWVSDYLFRGVFQAESSAYAGVDYSADNGLYVGTWWADVNQGTETDVYVGWQGGSDNVQFKIGYTGYRYLDDFDGDYDEINLGLYAGIFALDVAVGQYDPLSSVFPGLDDQDYVFTSITLSPEVGPYYKVGVWTGDYKDNVLFPNAKTFPNSGDADYFEIGYAYSLEEHGIDLTAALTYSPDLPLAIGSTGEYTVTFGIKKTFEPKK